MEKLKNIIQNKSDLDLTNEDFSNAIEKTSIFIDLIEKNDFFNKLNPNTKSQIYKNSVELTNQIKNYQSNKDIKDIKYIQLINHYLVKLYDLLLSEYDNFKELLLSRINKIENKLSV